MRNIGLGAMAGANLTTGSNNIVIGYNVNLPSATGSYQLNIGNLIFGTGINGTENAISSGKIGIGTAAPAARLHVAGDGRFEGRVRIAPQGDVDMGPFTQEP